MRNINRRSLFSSIALKISSALAKFLLIKVTLAYVDISEYGAYTYSMAIFLFIMMLSRFGMDLYLQKEISSSRISGEDAVSQVISVSLFSVLVTGCCALYFHKTEYLIFWLFFIVASFFHTSSWVVSYILKGKGYIKESIAIYELTFPLLNIMTIIAFGYFTSGIKVILLSYLTSLIMTFLVLFVFVLDKGVATHIKFVKPNIKESYNFSLVAISTMLLVLGDTYLIGILLSDYYVGIYSLTAKVGMFVLLPTAVVTTYINNFVSKNISNKMKIKRMLAPSIALNFVIVALFSVMVYLVSPYILYFLNVTDGDENIIIELLAIYLLAQVIMGSTGAFESVLMMGGGQKKLLYINMFMIVSNFSLGWLFITEFGVYGAVYSTLISCLVSRLIQTVIIYRKVLPIDV